MATILEFSRNIRKRASNIENGAVDLVKRVAKTALRELVAGTPVKTGKARSNWRASVGGTPTAILDPRSAQATINDGVARINTLKVGSSRRGTGQAGSSVRIVNNIPYLDFLRNGGSKQQPEDWVAIALLKAESEIGSVRLLEPPRLGDDDGA